MSPDKPDEIFAAAGGPDAGHVLVPVMESSVSAGFPSPAEQYTEMSLDLNDLLVNKPSATYYVRVAGDSMTGAGIMPGDILVVDRSLEPRDGSVVIAAVNGEFTVKRFRKDGNGSVRLVPENKKYRPITFSDGMELTVFGVVTASVHRFVKYK